MYLVRVETSGAPFRGFAIQARESTPSFSTSAAFVGEFVNAGGNWRIWNCAAVSYMITAWKNWLQIVQHLTCKIYCIQVLMAPAWVLTHEYKCNKCVSIGNRSREN